MCQINCSFLRGRVTLITYNGTSLVHVVRCCIYFIETKPKYILQHFTYEKMDKFIPRSAVIRMTFRYPFKINQYHSSFSRFEINQMLFCCCLYIVIFILSTIEIIMCSLKIKYILWYKYIYCVLKVG